MIFVTSYLLFVNARRIKYCSSHVLTSAKIRSLNSIRYHTLDFLILFTYTDHYPSIIVRGSLIINHQSMIRKILPFLREIVFGLEDGMVSTLGAITGIAGATGNKSLVIISGLVIVAVESLSMAAGTYLSNKSELQAEDVLNHNHKKITNKPIIDGIYMGFSYILGGFIALTSYLILPINIAMPSSIIITVFALFTVGAVKGKITENNSVKSGLEMTTVSLTAALLGFVIGKLASSFFPMYTVGL